jgi:hypothetical protein
MVDLEKPTVALLLQIREPGDPLLEVLSGVDTPDSSEPFNNHHFGCREQAQIEENKQSTEEKAMLKSPSSSSQVNVFISRQSPRLGDHPDFLTQINLQKLKWSCSSQKGNISPPGEISLSEISRGEVSDRPRLRDAARLHMRMVELPNGPEEAIGIGNCLGRYCFTFA